MRLDGDIRAVTITAAVVWSTAGVIEFAAGYHGWAAADAGVAAFALIVDATWRVMRRNGGGNVGRGPKAASDDRAS